MGLLSTVSHAHHSAIGRFDTDRIIEIEGDVIRVDWRNPHSFFVVETVGDGGQPVTWTVEAGAASYLLRIGIERESIQLGDRIRVAGQAPLTDERETFATNILAASGEELLVRVRAEPRWTERAVGDRTYQSQSRGDSSRPELGLFRVWSHTNLSPLFRNRAAGGSAYPLTPAANAALTRFDPARDNPTRDCVPKGMPTIMEQPYPMEFVRAGPDIVLRIEEYDTRRTIHMGRDGVPDGTLRSPLGYSRGVWESSALVVTTTHISWPWFSQLGIPQSTDAVLVERFTPTEDGSQLDYELTVTDPANFTEPVRLTKYWLDIPGRDVRPFNCTVTD